MTRAPLDYDAADDGAKSYLAAIESKRLRGDNYYLRQPDDPGVDNPPIAEVFPWGWLIVLFSIQLAIIGAFAWVVLS